VEGQVLWGYDSDGKIIRYTLEPRQVLIHHRRCGFEVAMPYEQLRHVDTVRCPNCDLELVSYREWVSGIEQSLRESASVKHRRQRMHTRRHLLSIRERLLTE
jgi:hypothetical protein